MAERKVYVPEFDHQTRTAVDGWESEGGLPFKPALFYGEPVKTTRSDKSLQHKKPDSVNPNKPSE